MIPLIADWRSATGRWGAGLQLLAGEPTALTQYVLGLACTVCSARYMTPSPAALPAPCPACGGSLRRYGIWDLCAQRAPGWFDELYDEVP
jgi:hypothetical protein